ncbi:hypothetical protein LOK49_LG03G00254 [Camellia lanceoleosa]|uniref:Uncharacterized protein n=1 Tax=Camellia lanceoleosa TaxID=1840588 RepID=A0ACC0I838_9ERIC|nr:hypothetical protein LOK49_LG03G00254 [Camellia lanceoleosa]
MAGSVVALASEHMEKSVTAIADQWEVEYSRFFNYPSLSSTFPTLIPLPDVRRDRFRGTWISSSSTASLNITADHSNSDFILTVNFLGKIHEEHYISKLYFSWPHVSCVSGFPSRGSRVVFVSYRDSLGQIQKFALRFSTSCEIEAFMNALKEILEDVRDTGLPRSNFASEMSYQSDFVPSDEPYRPKKDWSATATIDSCTHQMQSSSKYEGGQNSNCQNAVLNGDIESIFAAFPPGFTSLMMSCQPVAEQAIAQPTEPEDNDLRYQITRYLGDKSFQDILCKVEKVMNEIGDDLLL